ncbi:MAG: TlpA disulfide reductase family protein [Schleiferiaceae bacterium]|nr:TlpA disulfide reductase family protein [Schleiferiaceae bacterium]
MSQYFTGIEGAYPSGIVILIGNLSSPSPTFYPDRNGNLDFSDDGPPVQMDAAKREVKLYLGEEASFGVRYEKMDSVIDPEWAARAEKIHKIDFYRQEGVPYLPYRSWLKVHRFNLKMDTLRWQGQDFRVGFYDCNVNGAYGDTLEDRWYFQPAAMPYSTKRINGARLLKPDSNWFEFEGQTYAVSEVDPLGESIRIRPIEKEYRAPLQAGQPLPDLPLVNLEDDNVSLHDFLEEERLLLIDFWGAWCKGCQHAAPSLRKMKKKYAQGLNILGINSGEPLPKIRSFLKEYEHSWPQGLANDRLINTFKVEGYPRYLLVDGEGKILSLDAELFEIEDYLAAKDKP